VQKNKANLPQIDFSLRESAPKKSTLNDYLKNQSFSAGGATAQSTLATAKPKHFKIDEDGY
jgi:hypothetical protein